MSQIKVLASQIIETLKSGKQNAGSEALLFELESACSDFENSKGKTFLAFRIETDEDFLVNGQSEFEDKIEVKHENAKVAFQKLILHVKSLNFTVGDNKKYKLDYFLKQISSNETLEKFMRYDGQVSVGGNQAFQAQVYKVEQFLDIGELQIDLSK